MFVYSLALRKTFHTVEEDILFTKLQAYGGRENACSLVNSSSSLKDHYVLCNGEKVLRVANNSWCSLKDQSWAIIIFTFFVNERSGVELIRFLFDDDHAVFLSTWLVGNTDSSLMNVKVTRCLLLLDLTPHGQNNVMFNGNGIWAPF